jgi:large subunit ribosomal protein L2
MGKRIIQQRRGRGSTVYRANKINTKGEVKIIPISNDVVSGKILDIIHCPQHSSPLVRIQYADGNTSLNIAAEGIAVNDRVDVGGEEVAVGNCLELGNIPTGSLVYNIELQPGDGGKLCRSSGTFARILSKMEKSVVLILPSKKQKKILGTCRANIGVAAGSGRVEKPLLKAGKAYYKYKAKNKLWPRTSGGSMNAVDHPFGNSRSSRKSKAKPAPKNAPPGRKVGMIRPRRSGRSKR